MNGNTKLFILALSLFILFGCTDSSYYDIKANITNDSGNVSMVVEVNELDNPNVLNQTNLSNNSNNIIINNNPINVIESTSYNFSSVIEQGIFGRDYRTIYAVNQTFNGSELKLDFYPSIPVAKSYSYNYATYFDLTESNALSFRTKNGEKIAILKFEKKESKSEVILGKNYSIKWINRSDSFEIDGVNWTYSNYTFIASINRTYVILENANDSSILIAVGGTVFVNGRYVHIWQFGPSGSALNSTTLEPIIPSWISISVLSDIEVLNYSNSDILWEDGNISQGNHTRDIPLLKSIRIFPKNRKRTKIVTNYGLINETEQLNESGIYLEFDPLIYQCEVYNQNITELNITNNNCYYSYFRKETRANDTVELMSLGFSSSSMIDQSGITLDILNQTWSILRLRKDKENYSLLLAKGKPNIFFQDDKLNISNEEFRYSSSEGNGYYPPYKEFLVLKDKNNYTWKLEVGKTEDVRGKYVRIWQVSRMEPCCYSVAFISVFSDILEINQTNKDVKVIWGNEDTLNPGIKSIFIPRDSTAFEIVFNNSG
ncbi:MAG: hypothetical protein AABX38_00180 [Candidatus Micrarchaeota archaeon]